MEAYTKSEKPVGRMVDALQLMKGPTLAAEEAEAAVGADAATRAEAAPGADAAVPRAEAAPGAQAASGVDAAANPASLPAIADGSPSEPAVSAVDE